MILCCVLFQDATRTESMDNAPPLLIVAVKGTQVYRVAGGKLASRKSELAVKGSDVIRLHVKGQVTPFQLSTGLLAFKALPCGCRHMTTVVACN